MVGVYMNSDRPDTLLSSLCGSVDHTSLKLDHLQEVYLNLLTQLRQLRSELTSRRGDSYGDFIRLNEFVVEVDKIHHLVFELNAVLQIIEIRLQSLVDIVG